MDLTTDSHHGVINDQRNRLIEDVLTLSEEFGPRNLWHYENLLRAEDFIADALENAGLEPQRQEYFAQGKRFANVVAEIHGTERANEIVVIGAHYDTHRDSPGANDNASSVAALLSLAREFHGIALKRTLRFVAFVNEERPFTGSKEMGSRVFARNCRRRGENIVAMLSLESIGCYLTSAKSQRWSFGGRLLPNQGNFVAVVSNQQSASVLDHVVSSLSRNSRLAFEALTLPLRIPGLISSDHLSFWKEKYPAVLITDTASWRDRNYHKKSDTAEKIDFEALDLVVDSLKQVIADLAISSELAAIAPELTSEMRWQEPVSLISTRVALFTGFALTAVGTLMAVRAARSGIRRAELNQRECARQASADRLRL